MSPWPAGLYFSGSKPNPPPLIVDRRRAEPQM